MDVLYHLGDFFLFPTLYPIKFEIYQYVCQCNSFIAKDAEAIKRFVQETCCRSVYVIMAQALDERVPPFVLQMFGTNGSFTACDIIRRWHHTKAELKKYVIIYRDFVQSFQ